MGTSYKGVTPAYQAMLDKVNAMSDEELRRYATLVDHPYQSVAKELLQQQMLEQLGPIGGEADPVQTAVDQATGGVTAQDIMAYLGETGPFMEGMDVNKDWCSRPIRFCLATTDTRGFKKSGRYSSSTTRSQ